MPTYRSGPHSKHDLKVPLVQVPKCRKPVLVGSVALRGRDLLREIALERELIILSGKVARDHVHRLIAYRPHQSVSPLVQWLKGSVPGCFWRSFPTSVGRSGDGTRGPETTLP